MENQEMFKVELSIFAWHELLKELEFGLSIINDGYGHSSDRCVELYEKIATQLNGRPVKIIKK